MTLSLRHAAASDTGLMRHDNQDSAYSSPHLIAVADGVSGNVHGEVASAVTIQTLARLDRAVPAGEATGELRAAVRDADALLRDMSETDPALFGMSTTLTALLCGDGTLHVAHVGDSRGYLCREGTLQQVTRDHSLVQALVDNGQLTPEEAAVHPQRSVILRAINGRGDVEADVAAHEPRVGDRWLLCSDGLSDYVATQAILETVTGSADLREVVGRLIALANDAGGPDNITCAVAEVVDTDQPQAEPMVVGAAATATARGGPGEEPTEARSTPWWHSLLGGSIGRQARVAGTPLPARASTPVRTGITVLELHR